MEPERISPQRLADAFYRHEHYGASRDGRPTNPDTLGYDVLALQLHHAFLEAQIAEMRDVLHDLAWDAAAHHKRDDDYFVPVRLGRLRRARAVLAKLDSKKEGA